MNDWRHDISSALADFRQVVGLCGDQISEDDSEIEYHPAPHRATGLPKGKMAVYCFWGDGVWLKIGKVGPNSDARYRSQHYQPGRAVSSLANSLCKDERMTAVTDSPKGACEAWIKAHTHRCNILLSSRQPKSLLSLLEAFLHHRLKPRYEG